MQSRGPALTLGLMRSLRFDSTLIFGCAFVALVSGYEAWQHPFLLWDSQKRQMGPILWADIWLLGSQHVIATYSRLCMDKASFREHRFLVLGLPWLVLLGVLGAICATGSCAIVATTYLYWQWFHYTRQSYGIHRIYARKAPPASLWDERLAMWTLYAVPLWGILYRSWHKCQFPGELFLFKDFWPLPTSEWMVYLTGGVALVLSAAWLLRQLSLYVDGKVCLTHTAYFISHLAIFVAGYYLIGDITCGWLTMNVWHNAQYIMIVWMYNNNRFKRGLDPKALVLSYISQRQGSRLPSAAAAGAFFGVGAYLMAAQVIDTKWVIELVGLIGLVAGAAVGFARPTGVWLYVTVMMAVTVAFYYGLQRLTEQLHYLGVLEGQWDPSMPNGGCGPTGPMVVILYQAVNFHHYIVDGFIWKVRKPQNQQRLGITPVEKAVEAVV